MPQREHHPIIDRHTHYRAPDALGKLCIAELLLRASAVRGRQVDIVIQGFAAILTQKVERFIDRDPVDPAEKLEFRVIFIASLGNLEKYFLRYVTRVISAAQHPERR